MRTCFAYIGSIIDPKYAAQAHNVLTAVGKGRSSPLNDMVHVISFRPGKHWQGDNLTQFCIVSKGKCFIVVPPKMVFFSKLIVMGDPPFTFMCANFGVLEFSKGGNKN